MRRILRSTAVEASLLAALSIFVLSGIDRVPFHPDEASLLYQSRDLEQLLSDPLDMAWEPSAAPSPEMTYRLLNAPLPKYVLGLGRRAAGFGPQAVAVDWDWSKTWIENAMLGALPGPRVLEAARTASATALLVGVAALYLATRRLAGRGAAIAAAVLLGINALALLHGRRAMAEGTLMMGVGIAVLGILSADRRPFLAGLAVAVAVASKTSTLPLLPIGWLAALWLPGVRKLNLTAAARGTLLYAAGFAVLTLALFPVLWRHPILAAERMVQERNELLARQVADIQMLAPDHVLSSAPQRSVVLVANLYLAPLQYAEVGNYLEELGPSIQQYQDAFGRDLLRSSAGGGFLLGLTLLGLAWGWRRAKRTEGDRGRAFVLLLLATIAQASALVIAIPLPVQRYMLPLLPFLCLWQGVGVAGGLAGPTTKRRPEVRAA
jgi:4-amino-4-deoxy-L-arabinose transferase-like glycosyltransferase